MGVSVRTAPADMTGTRALWQALPDTQPAPLAAAASFGFGDRTGLATPGHAAAMFAQGRDIAPIFVQQSIREMERTGRTPEDVMSDGVCGAVASGWQGPVGADADHLKTPEHVDVTARAGFVFFTIDPSDHVDQRADGYSPAQVEEKFAAFLADKVAGGDELLPLYSGSSYTLDDESGTTISLDELTLKRAAVKYGRALAHIKAMALHIAAQCPQGFELEISVDETDQPTSVPEHLFLALELKRREVPVVSLAPRFIGDFEKGVDFRGDIAALEETLKQHAAIAREYGPYKISLHSGSDKFSVYPLLAKATESMFHVKTAGTSYLEALRAVGRVDPGLFTRVIEFSRSRFDTDKATYHISATLDQAPEPGGLSTDEREEVYLNQDPGRQILHVTFGSVLTVQEGGNLVFKDDIFRLLQDNKALHEEVLAAHLGRHLRGLAG
ncbi:MAG: hypothetical protein D6E12_18675 [Desulfovibrio sp.]|nr:MAG: hypothetical protein D6E12_18675 [Desulfovibrio sp.]